MFRHSDGNKNSWEREKANKAFLSIRHHRHNWGLHFIKISEVFGRCVFLQSSCGRMGEGHKIPGFHRSSPASHLPHPTARFVPCCAFLLPPVTHFFNILARICATSQKFLFFQTAISRGSRSKNVAQWCLLSQHQPPQAKAKKQYIATLLKLLMNGHKLFPCQILHHSLRAGGGDVTSC